MYEMEGVEKWKLSKSCKKRGECKINVEAGDEWLETKGTKGQSKETPSFWRKQEIVALTSKKIEQITVAI